MEELFLKILNMSLMAGYCVLAILLVRLFIRKLPKIYSYVLWSVVYFRLVCPVSLESVLSLIKINPRTVSLDATERIMPRIQSGIAGADKVVNAGLQTIFPAGNSIPDGAVSDIAIRMNPLPASGRTPVPVWLFAASVIWIMIAVLLLVGCLWSALRLNRQMQNIVWIEQNIYEVENLQTPFVLGLWKPRIYLPAHLDAAKRRCVLAHEQIHIKRRDYLLKQAAFLVTCVYWFHPLVWLAFYLMCQDMEMSCDERVIRSLGGQIKKEYSASLLSLASGRRIYLGSPLAFGENNIKVRIRNVLSYKRPTFLVSISFAVILAAMLIGLALNPKEYAQAQNSSNRRPEELGAGWTAGTERDGESEGIGSRDENGGAGWNDGMESTGENDRAGSRDTAAGADGRNAAGEPAGADGSSRDENDADAAAHYEGYLDESPYAVWSENWKNCDFDADGKRDRIYRGVTENAISYRIDFGNGEKLEIGTFEDLYTGISIQTADVEGDGTMEILFVGAHEAENTPLAESEIALFYKKDGSYHQQELYQERTEEIKPIDMHAGNRGGQHGRFSAGFDIYAYDMGEEGIWISSPETEQGEMMFVPEELDYKKMYRPDYSPVLAAGQAYDAEFVDREGKICLGLYENPGGRWIDWSWRFVLSLENLGDASVSLTERVVYRDMAGTCELLPKVSRQELAVLRETKVEEQLKQWEKQPHRKTYQNAVLQMYLPKRLSDSVYIKMDMLTQENSEALAQEALRELYELTGTEVEECCYYYTDNYDFNFALTKEDMESGRIFYSRNFGEVGTAISSMWLTNARNLWYSPIYQYDLPADFGAYTDSEKAVWFLKKSALYNGKETAICVQPYAGMPEVWQIVMEDDTAYEVTLDSGADTVGNIAGPYPDSNIGH